MVSLSKREEYSIKSYFLYAFFSIKALVCHDTITIFNFCTSFFLDRNSRNPLLLPICLSNIDPVYNCDTNIKPPLDQHLQGISKCLSIYNLSNFGIAVQVKMGTEFSTQCSMIMMLLGCSSEFFRHVIQCSGRCSGIMVGVLDSGVNSPGSSPDQGHCVVFLGKTLTYHSASLHSGV